MMGGRREPDPYRLLGVAHDAPEREIRRAYRRLARQQHPDLNPRPDGPERFAALTRAYELLTDPIARARYDARASRAASAHPTVTREASRAGAPAGQAIGRRATLELSHAEAGLLAGAPLRLSDRIGHTITLPAGTADGDRITVRYRGHVVLLTVHVRTKT
jgi:curved DNA-binding protein CbpA